MRRLPRIVLLSLVLLPALMRPAVAQAQSPSSTPTPDPSATASSSPAPNASPAPSPSTSVTPTASPRPSRVPSPSASPTASSTGSPTASASPKRSTPSPTGPSRLATVKEIEAVRAQMAALAKDLAMWQAQHRRTLESIEMFRGRLSSVRSEATARRAQFQDSARSFYMSGSWQQTFAIMRAGNLEDAGRASVYASAVFGEELEAFGQFRRAVARFESVRAMLTRHQTDLVRIERTITTRHAGLARIKQKLESMIGDVIERFGRGSASFAATIRAAQAGQVPALPANRFVYHPVAGRLTSPYGNRVHPILDRVSFHTGVDIAASGPAALLAPRDGVVIAVGDAGPFGLATVIDHGSRIATVLAHQSTTIVRKGERVVAGQIVGYQGCTGWCTGPHVHLEVWFDGRPVDPAGWLVDRPPAR